MSWFGSAVLDDSKSLLMTEDGWVTPRKKGVQDLYFFGYGWNFRLALKDFYHLCGQNSDASEICTRKLVEPLLALQ